MSILEDIITLGDIDFILYELERLDNDPHSYGLIGGTDTDYYIHLHEELRRRGG